MPSFTCAYSRVRALCRGSDIGLLALCASLAFARAAVAADEPAPDDTSLGLGPGMGLDPTRTLVLSQVVLSFGLPFAIIPLVMFTRRADIMGDLVNRRITTISAALIAGLIVLLNAFLLYKTFTSG